LTSLLPNGARAILDIRKLADYCLNPAHLRGRHKARVFRQALRLNVATPPSCGTDCWRRRATTSLWKCRATFGEADGGSMSRYRDKASALW
jgi:hypothetical protein